MDAVLLSFGFFLFFAVLGYASIVFFRPQVLELQGLLLAPAVGISISLIGVFLINRLGVPVQSFGRSLVLSLFALAVLVLGFKRPRLVKSEMLSLVLVLIGALLLVGWPMFSSHFNWLSYGNDDMTNYTLAAQRFLQVGYFDLPNLNDLFSGRNNSLVFWIMHAVHGMRPGSELMLALAWAATGLNAHQIFMPLIIALHLALICSGAALVGEHRLKIILIAMGLMAISPLSSLGVLYQLIGQVGGLALLCAAIVLFCRRMDKPSWRTLGGTGVIGGIVFAAAIIWYPEILPFLGFTWLFFLTVSLLQNKTQSKSIVLPAVTMGLMALLFIGPFIVTALHTLLSQATQFHADPASVHVVLFPYFQLPTGIPVLFGLLPLAGWRREPLSSLAIFLGLFVFFWLMKHVLQQIRALYPAAMMVVVMLAVTLFLFVKQNDFGLFKLAMYAQPFLIAVVVIALSQWDKNTSWMAYALLALFVAASLVNQFSSVVKSTGEVVGFMNEIPHASAHKINEQFQAIVQANPQQTHYIFDTSLVVIAKLQSLYTQGIAVDYPSRSFFSGLLDKQLKRSLTNSSAGLVHQPGLDKNYLHDYKKAYDQRNQKAKFTFAGLSNDFVFVAIPKNVPWIITHHQTIFNHQHDQSPKDIEVLAEPHNHLVFIHSQLGPHYYSEGREKGEEAFSQLESDPLFPGQLFSGLGRYPFLMVVGPSEKLRLQMELSSSILRQFAGQLPQPSVLGSKKTDLVFVGRGSGRIVSEPLDLGKIQDQYYLQLDMGREPKPFPMRKRGLILLYGRNVRDDWRYLSTFARDISLISEEEFQASQPPAQLVHFPQDLSNSALQYSGLYEDGWISEQAFFILSPLKTTEFLEVRGSVPFVPQSRLVRLFQRVTRAKLLNLKPAVFNTCLTVMVDGKVLGKQQLASGSFRLKLPVQGLEARSRIELIFDQSLALPRGDERVVSAKLDFIGFKES
jgi:hypothetical protein